MRIAVPESDARPVAKTKDAAAGIGCYIRSRPAGHSSGRLPMFKLARSIPLSTSIELRAGDGQAGIGGRDGEGMAGNDLHIQFPLSQFQIITDFAVKLVSPDRNGRAGIYHHPVYLTQHEFLLMIVGRYRHMGTLIPGAQRSPFLW